MNCVSTGKKVDTFIMYTEIHGHIVTDDPPPPEMIIEEMLI